MCNHDSGASTEGAIRELARAYDPTQVEGATYRLWEEHNAFGAPVNSDKPSFSITIPPPNVTGELHLGHALQHTIHDTILRRKRMLGFNALCLPGTDHAGISTNIKVAQALIAEGRDRWAVGRTGFVERAREWTLTYGGAILNQLRALGCSYDWSRTRFTLDEFVEEGRHTATWALGPLYQHSGYARAVLTAFVRFYEKGWIFRGERMVNWCPNCRTTLSELELEHIERDTQLWHIRYPAADGGPGLVVATTRPETLLGDTGVAVAPADDRYRRLVDTHLRLPLMDRLIPVVADEHVDPKFGTGAVKVTPAHDVNDWEIAQRHPELLPAPTVIGDDGAMTDQAGAYSGLSREEARRRVLADLSSRGLLVKTETHSHKAGRHDKCRTVIEPMLKPQWWVDCTTLAANTAEAIRSGRVRFIPERFRQMELEWLEAIRPWCVSRQLWWGHRIPLYYCRACTGEHLEFSPTSGEIRQVLPDARPFPSVGRPAQCPLCGGTDLHQDPDALDTWFSSALWPIATLGWPEATPDLEQFYPTDLMITGRDILYLWVARMIMTGLEFAGKEPFRDVLVHATVLTEEGQRMSKTLGTGVDPLELIRLYGADATRLGLASLVTESQDIRFKFQWKSGGKVAAGPDDALARAEQVEQMRNFCNKLWNVSRFVLMNLGEDPPLPEDPETLEREGLELADRWILSRLASASRTIDEALDDYDLGKASWALYHFIWDEFADWYVELSKPRLRSGGDRRVRTVLVSVLEVALRLAHPFVPFISEELWHALPGCGGGRILMTERYPSDLSTLVDPEAESAMARTIEVIRTIRNVKAELGVPFQAVDLWLSDPDLVAPSYVETGARARVLTEKPAGPGATRLTAGIEVVVNVAGLIDVEAERKRLSKEIDGVRKELASVEAKLANEQFVNRAPAAVVEKQRAIRQELIDREGALARRRSDLPTREEGAA